MKKLTVREEKMTDIYIVKAGDTLWSISKKYNITVDKLVKLNGLYGNTKDDLKIGQKIKLKEDDCYWSTKTTIGCANTFPPIIPVSVRAFTKSFTAFVGGAADKYQFLNRPFGIDPPDDIGLGPTEIMKNCMEKFKKKIGTKVNNASFGYYGYEEAYSNKRALLHKRNSSPYSLDEYRIKKPLQNNQLG